MNLGLAFALNLAQQMELYFNLHLLEPYNF